MQLQPIDKKIYRRNLNRLIIAMIIFLALGSIGIAQALIYLFTDRSGTHFWLNLFGVAATAIIIATLLHRFRSHPWMREIVYVWDLKQELNRITRRLTKVLAGVERGEKAAMTILNFSYQGSQQLYQLDDNTITLDDLDKSIAELEQTIAAHGFHISLSDYDPAMLARYR